MSDIHIVYTEETSHFKMHIPLEGPGEQITNPDAERLRSSYLQLREVVPGLPQRVGVVTYDNAFKRLSREELKERREDDSIAHVTSYGPLDILEAALSLRGEDVSSHVTMQYVSRTLECLIMYGSIGLDHTLPSKARGHWTLASISPVAVHVASEVERVASIVDQTKLRGRAPNLHELSEMVRATYPSWEDLQKIHDYLLARFEANRVSREFPLNFMPPGNVSTALYTVDTHGERKLPSALAGAIESLRKLSGDEEFPPDVLADFDKHQVDTFGITRTAGNLAILLEKLPKPATIITDIYIVDAFPELRAGNLKTTEFSFDV